MSDYFDDFIERIKGFNSLADTFAKGVREDADYDAAFFNELWAAVQVVRPDIHLLKDCLEFSVETGTPLPPEIAEYLLSHVKVLISGRNSTLLCKQGTKPKTSRLADLCQEMAANYVRICKHTGWDSSPVATASGAFGVNRSSVQKWVIKYPPLEDLPDTSDDQAKALVLINFGVASKAYRDFSLKPK